MDNMKKSMISLIVPCYNEEESLRFLMNELNSVAQDMNEYLFEFIFIDDGSKDSTNKIIADCAMADSRIKYISFSRNFGKEAAMYAGLKNAKGEYVAIMDADMQDPPRLLPEMIKIIELQGYDIVATRRSSRKGEPVIRSMFARLFYRIINIISDAEIIDGARDFKLMKRNMVDAILQMGEYNRFSKGIFGWVGFKTFWLPYENVERIAGETKWNFWKLTKYAFDGITDFSQVPLSVASWIGLAITCVSFIMVIVVIVRKLLFGDPVSGWASIVSILLFLSGVQLFCMGIIGQYLAKVFLETKHRPIYLIDKSNITDVK